MKIQIYSTTTCPYCKQEKAYLDGKKIAYENIFVDEDEAKAEEMIKKSGQMGVPVIEIGDQIVVGYDVSTFKKLLKFN